MLECQHVTVFVTGSNTFSIGTRKKYNASIEHITCRDKCTAQVSPLPTAFQPQAAANRSDDERISLTLSTLLQKEDFPSLSSCQH